ncbi:MAG: tetratricopeptide repeat protein [Candidatus Kapaibacterium sp.]
MSKAETPVQPEELAQLIHRVRSLSGCIRVARILEERDLNLTYAKQNIQWLSVLINKFQVLSYGLPPIDQPFMAESRSLLRSYTLLLILRSGQYSVSALNLALGEKDARDASDIALRLDDNKLYSLALNHLGNCLLSQQKIIEGLQVLSLTVEIERREGDEAGLARSLYNLARGEIAVGEYEEAEKHVEEAIQLYESSPHLPQYGQAFLFAIRQTLYENNQHFGAALIDGHRSLSLLQHIGMRDRIGEAHYNLVRIYLQLDNVGEAMFHATEILPSGEEASANTSTRCFYCLSIGAIELRLSHYDKAEDYLQRGLNLAEESGHTMFEAMFLERLAEVARRQGFFPKAEKLLQRGLGKEGHRLKRMHIYKSLAKIALEQGNIEKAESSFREAVMQIHSLPGKRQRKDLTIVESDILNMRGEPQKAIELLLTIANDSEVKLSTRADIHLRLHEIYRKEGMLERALYHYQEYHAAEVEHERMLGEHRMVSLRTSHEDRQTKVEWQQLQERYQQKERALEQLTLKMAEYQQRVKKIEYSILQTIKLLSNSQPDIEKCKDQLQRLTRTMKATEKQSHDMVVPLSDNDREFFKRLGKQYPELTSNQKRLCGLLRAGFTSAEITSLLHVTPETLATQRKRLRKKLQIPRSVKLEQMLASL